MDTPAPTNEYLLNKKGFLLLCTNNRQNFNPPV